MPPVSEAKRHLVIVVRHNPGTTAEDRRHLDDLCQELKGVPSLAPSREGIVIEETWAANAEDFVSERETYPNSPKVTLIFTSSRDIELARTLRQRHSQWSVLLLTASIPGGEITILSKWWWNGLDAETIHRILTYGL